MMEKHVVAWSKCLKIFRENVSSEDFDTYFSKLTPLALKEEELWLSSPSQYIIEYIEENYLALIRTAIHSVIGDKTTLHYRVMIASETQTTIDMVEGVSLGASLATNYSSDKKKNPKDPFEPKVYNKINSQLNSKYTFNNFYKGKSNLLARSIGEQIASNPGNTAFNPLFLYGGSGVGKTHLVNAIGLEICEKFPDKRVLYLSAHQFQVQFSEAVVKNTQNDFVNFYQSIDVLIVDDIQELAGKTGTQNTFFHVFNHLHQNGKQLIMSSDKPPIALMGVEERLLTRFKWGITVEIESPDIELRQTILLNKVRREGLDIPDDVIKFVATNIKNARDLEGIILSLMAHSMILNRPINIELAERVVFKNIKIEKKVVNIDSIIQKVSEYFTIPVETIISKSRKQEIVSVRHIAMYLCKELTENSLSAIGSYFGKRNHATVLHACKSINNLRAIDKKIENDLTELRKQIKL